eukprot:CAMPEP_0170842998 /NCGR_PEP_ID=MMETSP0734-20130129/6036_1 /TAXON_ID=186038 /ORGANISM="Fragilariopsis kerguelensis, Strain L26-C5" /LENGTH=52 /DNA_ID=CAMNT_0011211163 /DNA_START=35 /DNA_END=193 /DNA_ORIENTATION=-
MTSKIGLIVLGVFGNNRARGTGKALLWETYGETPDGQIHEADERGGEDTGDI